MFESITYYIECAFLFCIFDALEFGGPDHPEGTAPLRFSHFPEIDSKGLLSNLQVCLSYTNQPVQTPIIQPCPQWGPQWALITLGPVTRQLRIPLHLRAH